MHQVLVTGSAGAIGRAVSQELERRGHRVRGFDRVPTPGLADAVLGDIADREAVRRAVAGMTGVIHLAAEPNEAPIEQLVGPNVLGVHHVLEAAHEHAVGRVVLASSVQVVGAHQAGRRADAAARQPGNLYALTKLWAEELGALYARRHGMSVAAVRIGWMVRNEREAEHMKRLDWFYAYLSRGDVARFMARAIEVAELPYCVLYAIGREGGERFDLETARRLLGWEPEDAFPEGLPFPCER